MVYEIPIVGWMTIADPCSFPARPEPGAFHAFVFLIPMVVDLYDYHDLPLRLGGLKVETITNINKGMWWNLVPSVRICWWIWWCWLKRIVIWWRCLELWWSLMGLVRLRIWFRWTIFFPNWCCPQWRCACAFCSHVGFAHLSDHRKYAAEITVW